MLNVATADEASNPRQTEYWQSLINEREAAAFVGLSHRTLQAKRIAGDGPQYVRISARCIRYRRADLKAWADGYLRDSTSDEGEGA